MSDSTLVDAGVLQLRPVSTKNSSANVRIPMKTPQQDRQDSSRPEHSDFVNQNIDSFLEHRLRLEQKVDRHQRAVELASAFVGRPAFVYGILIFVGIWIAANTIPLFYGRKPFDEPPYFWLQGMVSLTALLTTVVILSTQRRQGKQTHLEAQLHIQVSLLTEQKIAKLIALVEELRQDLPNVKNRYDGEAEAMRQSADPQQVLSVLEEKIEAMIGGETTIEEATQTGVMVIESTTEAGIAALEAKAKAEAAALKAANGE